MARDRKTIRAEFLAIKAKIQELQKATRLLYIEGLLLCDKEQWYTETEEERGRGKKKEIRLIGRVHWNEDFKDEDTDTVVTIERSKVVRENGEWVF